MDDCLWLSGFDGRLDGRSVGEVGIVSMYGRPRAVWVLCLTWRPKQAVDLGTALEESLYQRRAYEPAASGNENTLTREGTHRCDR